MRKLSGASLFVKVIFTKLEFGELCDFRGRLRKAYNSTDSNYKDWTRLSIAQMTFLRYSNPTSLFYFISMAKQVQLIQLRNKSTGEVYWTRKNKKKVERKIEIKKYSAKLRKHVVFKEAKK